MRTLFYLLLTATVLFSCKAQKESQSASDRILGVEGQLTYTLPYCKGIAPTPEELEFLNTPKPFFTMLYLRSGSLNSESNPIIDSVSTDKEGKFVFNVPPGDYLILLPEQRYRESIDDFLGKRKKFLAVDSLCLEKWWEKGLFQITVQEDNIVGLNARFRKKCDVPGFMPCASYTGPARP